MIINYYYYYGLIVFDIRTIGARKKFVYGFASSGLAGQTLCIHPGGNRDDTGEVCQNVKDLSFDLI
jgi:hypothetical protein